MPDKKVENMKIRWADYMLGLAAVSAGALGAEWLGWPIPWLLGPLLVSAGLSVCGVGIRALPFGRQAGLTVIGMSLGLYFTPPMIALLWDHALWMLGGMVFAVLLGVIGTYSVYRFARVDLKTAWFASAVGGASEMAYLAGQYGARVDKVVAAHSLRVLMIVTIVPFFYQFMGYHGLDDSVLQINRTVNWGGLLLLILCCIAVGWLFLWRNWSNPWTFGPLTAAMLLTAAEIHLSAVPEVLSHAGQLLIGWALGTKFGPDFFRSAPRLLAVTAVVVIIGLGLTALFSYGLSLVTDIPFPTLGLGLAPGGVAEMTVTAKVLHLGVPVVTAFHVCRMIAVVGTAGWFSRLIERKWPEQR